MSERVLRAEAVWKRAGVFRRRGFDGREAVGSGGHRPDQRSDAEDRDHPLHIVGQHVEAHLGSHLGQGLGEEVRRAHPGLDRSERVLG